MIAFAVYAQQVIARFRVGTICFLAEIKRYIQEVYDLLILIRAIEITPHHSEIQHPETQRSSANTSGH